MKNNEQEYIAEEEEEDPEFEAYVAGMKASTPTPTPTPPRQPRTAAQLIEKFRIDTELEQQAALQELEDRATLRELEQQARLQALDNWHEMEKEQDFLDDIVIKIRLEDGSLLDTYISTSDLKS